MIDLKDARKKYRQHATDCKVKPFTNGKPVQMKLTFEEWLQFWINSGHWHKRGRGKGKYVMGRFNDEGHYELGNVFILEHGDNVRQAQVGSTRSKATRLKQSKTQKGRPLTREHLENMKKAGMNMPAERRKELSDKEKARPKVECKHCHRLFSASNHSRWHGENCRNKEMNEYHNS